jgi:hypothetical protein
MLLGVDLPVPSGNPEIGAYIALMAVGFTVGVVGHIVRSNTLVAIGIGLVFLAVIVLPLVVHGGE